MPKPAFFSIPKEKQDRILNAALAEFSEHEYSDASINQMIKVASIPRGSFYQYFEGKDDLFFHLFSTILEEERHTLFQQYPDVLPSDLLAFHHMIFHFNLQMLGSETYRGFFRNLFLSMNYRFARRYQKIVEQSRANAIAKLGLSDSEKELQFSETFAVLVLITWDLLALKATADLPDEEIWSRYQTRLHLIGLIK